MKNITHKKFYSRVFLLPALSVYFVFFILPNILSLVFGFTSWTTYNITEIKFNGLDNFRQMLKEPVFTASVIHTFYFAFAKVILTNLIGFFLALILDMKLKLQKFYRSVFFIPTTLSIIVIAPIFSALYNPQNGLINVFLRDVGLGFMAKEWLENPKSAMNCVIVMSLWANIGLTILLYLSGLQSVPKEYYEAGEIDGCSYFQKLRYVSIPLIMSSITVNFVLSLISGLKVFGQVYALTNGGPSDATQVFGTFIFKNFGAGLLGYSSAVGLVFTIIVCILTFILVGILRKLEVEF